MMIEGGDLCIEMDSLSSNQSSQDIIDVTHMLDWSSYCAIDWSVTLSTPVESVILTISEADVPDNAGRLSEVTLASHSSS